MVWVDGFSPLVGRDQFDLTNAFDNTQESGILSGMPDLNRRYHVPNVGCYQATIIPVEFGQAQWTCTTLLFLPREATRYLILYLLWERRDSNPQPLRLAVLQTVEHIVPDLLSTPELWTAEGNRTPIISLQD